MFDADLRARARRARPRRLVALIGALVLSSAALSQSVVAHSPEPSQSHRLFDKHATSTATIQAAAAPIQSGFVDSTVMSGFDHPTAIRFSPSGKVVVAEQGGRVKIFDSLTATTPTAVIDLTTNVHYFWNRGLLGLALDPSFDTNGNIYVLYTYDHILGSTAAAPRWGDGCPQPPGATTDGCVVSGRLSKIQVTGGTVGPENVLIEDWCQQFPSHSVGNLMFGRDRYLYATAGDGASFNNADWGNYGGSAGSPTLANPCGDPPNPAGTKDDGPTARGGSLRSQSVRRPAGEPISLDGALLRIDPATGFGAPGNPLAASANVNARRIAAYGFRNPFRFTFRPGTDEVWIGDVGNSTWEEIDRYTPPTTTKARNYGWPCYEGALQQSGWETLNMCSALYADTLDPSIAPYYTYRHTEYFSPNDPGSNCVADHGSSITGIAFNTSTVYPSKYAGALFFADHTRNCIWAMLAGTDGLPKPGSFETLMAGGNPVDLEVGPAGDLFYVDLEAGLIHRITYGAAGGNAAPTAVATATSPTSGPAPLTVGFSSAGSADPDAGDTITYSWDLDGNGIFGDSTLASPSYTYTNTGSFTAALRVTDNHGAVSNTATVSISVSSGNTPPVPIIDAPANRTTFAVGDKIELHGPRDRYPGRDRAAIPTLVDPDPVPLPGRLPHPPPAVVVRHGHRPLLLRPRARLPVLPHPDAHGDGQRGIIRVDDRPARPEDRGPQFRDLTSLHRVAVRLQHGTDRDAAKRNGDPGLAEHDRRDVAPGPERHRVHVLELV